MYVVEFTEDEYENISECIHKGVKYITKAMECMEKIHNRKHSKDTERYIDDEDDDYEEEDRRHGSRRHRVSSKHRYDNY